MVRIILLRFVQNNLIVALCLVLPYSSICICGRIMGVIRQVFGTDEIAIFVGLIVIAICWHSFIRFCFPIMVAFNEFLAGGSHFCIRCFFKFVHKSTSIFQNFLSTKLSILALALMKTLSTVCRLPRTIPLETHIFKTSLNKFKRLLRHINREFG